jgi:hypothetical protein
MTSLSFLFRPCLGALSYLAACWFAAAGAHASDHIDTPTVTADPRADIGDLYAWISRDGERLNLVMTIVGQSFSDELSYSFHIDSGRRFGRTSSSVTLDCRVGPSDHVDCTLGQLDRVSGNAGRSEGIISTDGHFRIFAGPRDDPFFNNVRGTRDAYVAATAALENGAQYDGAGCPQFTPATSLDILSRWQQTGGAPGSNFLAGWRTMAIVASVNLKSVTRRGNMLAIWGSTSGPDGQLDRAARPLTGNALLGTVGAADRRNRLKEDYNRNRPTDADQFVSEIANGLALYDGFDGQCGNSLLANHGGRPSQRYGPLALLLADDRLWLNSKYSVCTQLLAVERAALNGEAALASDCGGRKLGYNAVNTYRSLLVMGATTGVDDGVHGDDKQHSDESFPFLAPPEPSPPSR